MRSKLAEMVGCLVATTLMACGGGDAPESGDTAAHVETVKAPAIPNGPIECGSKFESATITIEKGADGKPATVNGTVSARSGNVGQDTRFTSLEGKYSGAIRSIKESKNGIVIELDEATGTLDYSETKYAEADDAMEDGKEGEVREGTAKIAFKSIELTLDGASERSVFLGEARVTSSNGKAVVPAEDLEALGGSCYSGLDKVNDLVDALRPYASSL